jgi:coenzyme F420-0:L-glutamate ligase/coenzyme F420-1:gamma-L-glutamate ligase
MGLSLTCLPGIPLVRPGDDLAEMVWAGAAAANLALQDGDVLVIAQKIVSKAEGRLVNLGSVVPSEAAVDLGARTNKDPRLAELILKESRRILRAAPGVVVVEHRLGFVCANAGIDHSNVAGQGKPDEEYVLLLPDDPDRSATKIRESLQAKSRCRLGVMIIDSHGRAWRMGSVGVCIGASGLPALVDERGWKDLFGYTLQSTVVAVADELAAAASLAMGQAAEGTPVVHARGFPYPLGEGRLADLLRPHDQDLFP